MPGNEPVGSLFVAMRASVAEIHGDMGKISSAVNSFGARSSRALQGVERSLNNSISGFVNMRAVVAGAVSVAIGVLARQFILFADEIGDTAARLNVSTTALQEWRYAATLSGTTAEDLTKAVETFQRRIGEVKMGGFTESVTKAQESLAKLGLRMSDLQNLTPEQQFELVIDRLKGIENPAQRAAIAFELMGKTATRLNQIIDGGSEGIRKLAAEAKKMGLILDEETIKKSGLAADELDRIGMAGRVSGATISAEMLPAFTRMREIITSPEFQEGLRIIARLINAAFGPPATRAAIEAEGGLELIQHRIEELRRSARAYMDMAEQRSIFTAPIEQTQLRNMSQDMEKEADRLQSLRDRFERGGDLTPSRPPPPADNEPFDLRSGERIKQALENLKLQSADARLEFRGLADGFPSLVSGFGAMGQAALKAYLEGKPLPDWARDLNKELNKVNAAKLHTEMLEPIEKFNLELERLNTLYSSGALTLEDYTRKLYQLRETLAQVDGRAISLQSAAQGIGQAFGSAAESAIVDFTNLHDVAVSLIKDIQRALIQAFVTRPITNSITNLLGGSGGWLNSLFGNAAGTWAQGTTMTRSDMGNVFQHGRVIPHAKGGILDRAVAWPMGSSIGTAAESKAEAIMPVARGPDGKLGVMAVGDGGGTQVNYNFSPGMTPADMAFIRGMIQQASMATEASVISKIRGNHQVDSSYLYS